MSSYALNIDRTAPSTPTLTYPINGENLSFLVFAFSGAQDSGAGLSGYTYQIAHDYNFLDIITT